MMFSFITRWFRKAIRQRPDLRLVMYTRTGCHLCDRAWELLTRYQQLYGFGLEKIDVDSTPDLAAHHGSNVPVVLVNHKLRFRGGVNEVLLLRLLQER